MRLTPDRLREMAQAAQQLADQIRGAQVELRAAPDRPTRGVGFRLDEAAGQLAAAVADLEQTAVDLQRLQDRTEGMCPAEWGCCPEHGGTLRGSGGKTWCTDPGCGRTWDYDRDGMPCTEPVAFAVRGVGDAPDSWGKLCTGHTITAQQNIDGVQVRALAEGGPR